MKEKIPFDIPDFDLPKIKKPKLPKMPTKINVSRLMALIACILSLVAVILGIVAVKQNYDIKHKETFIVQNISKGEGIIFDGQSLTLTVNMTISNNSYNNIKVGTVKYSDRVFYASVAVGNTVYSNDTKVVPFVVSRQLDENQIAYFTTNYGVGGVVPLEVAYAYILNNGDTSVASTNRDTYFNDMDVSFSTVNGTSYSN